METPQTTGNSADIYSVTRLNREVRAVLEGSFRTLWVKGEISNLAIPASGHMYFSLKDDTSQVRCAMFKNRNHRLKFKPENGDEILVQANVSLYEGRGEFQLIVQDMEPAGLGALQKAFEQLKAKLTQEGLFDEAHKQLIPEFPQTIGVITSPTGAAIRDILTTLKRRYPMADVIVYPVPVQGVTAAGEIAVMMATANMRNEADVLILARGGGSLEDLWSFNEEVVARAIFASHIPVVTGIGHEIDFTIADFVADLRAPTPTSAAEHVSQDINQIRLDISKYHTQLVRWVSQQVKNCRQDILNLNQRLPHPEQLLRQIRQKLDELNLRLFYLQSHRLENIKHMLLQLKARLHAYNPQHLIQAWQHKNINQKRSMLRTMDQILKDACSALQLQTRQLETVSPLATLSRGYSVTRHLDRGQIVTNANSVYVGERIMTIFSHGEVESQVEKIHPSDRISKQEK